VPRRIECYDISNIQGALAVGSMVVLEKGRPKPPYYRRFRIKTVTGADDYAMIQETLRRRFKHGLASEDAWAAPDLVLIDGGRGQVTQAMTVLRELQLSGVEVIGVAKGVTRKAGFETLINGATGQETQLPGDNAALHLIQQIRDEAHRFAITGHRARRDKARQRSVLEDIPGVGARRRRELLRHFGSAQGVENANVEELKKISGISATMAQQIYDHLHHIVEPAKRT